MGEKEGYWVHYRVKSNQLLELAEELKISEDRRYFISKLIRDQKLKVTDLEVL